MHDPHKIVYELLEDTGPMLVCNLLEVVYNLLNVMNNIHEDVEINVEIAYNLKGRGVNHFSPFAYPPSKARRPAMRINMR